MVVVLEWFDIVALFIIFRKLRFDVIKDYTSKLRPSGEKNRLVAIFLLFLNIDELCNKAWILLVIPC